MKLGIAFAVLTVAQAIPAGDLEFLKPASAIGLAGVIFYFYRQDRQTSEARYEKLALQFQITLDKALARVCPLTRKEQECQDP